MTFPVEMSRSFEARSEGVSAFLSFFEEWADDHDLSPTVATPLQLMLDEWLTNVATHGYSGRGGPVEVKVCCGSPDRAEVWVTDAAAPFDPHDAPVPDTTRSLEDRPVGGLGIHFIRRMASRLEYRRVGEQNQLHLVREVPAT